MPKQEEIKEEKVTDPSLNDELEVMAITEQLKQLSSDLLELDKKYDGKMDNFDKKLDTRFDKLEAKIEKAVTELTALSNKISDKVTVINTDVVKN